MRSIAARSATREALPRRSCLSLPRAWLRRPALACLALLAVPVSGSAQPEDAAERIPLMIRDASRALQAGNAPLFLAVFDFGAVPDFASFREQVTALTEQRRIASSVAVSPVEGGTEVWTVRVDWLLELAPKLDPGPLERRRETVTVKVRKRGKRWEIVSLDRPELFAAQPRPVP